jgi:regulator of sirC expression with transglutaminase-like and TPR domain
MGLPPRVVIPIVTVFAVVFLGIMGYFLRIGFGTTGAAFGPTAVVHEQGDSNLQATPVPGPTDPPGTLTIPQSGGGAAAPAGPDAPAAQDAPAGAPPGNPVGGGGPPAPVLALLNDLHARIARNPDDIAALVELGNLYFDAQKFDQAIGYYEKALKLDPTNPDVRNDEAAALHSTGHDLEALHQIDRVLAERPHFPQALFNQGIILRSMGRRSDAIASYRAFLAAAPRDPHAGDARSAIKELGG